MASDADELANQQFQEYLQARANSEVGGLTEETVMAIIRDELDRVMFSGGPHVGITGSWPHFSIVYNPAVTDDPAGDAKATEIDPGFTVTFDSTARTCTVSPSVLVGLNNVGVIPTISGSSLLAGPTLSASNGDFIFVRVELVPIALGTTGAYYIDPLNYTLDSCTVVASATLSPGDATRAAIALAGTVTNGVFYIPLAAIVGGAAEQLMYGPIGVEYTSGALVVSPPIFLRYSEPAA